MFSPVIRSERRAGSGSPRERHEPFKDHWSDYGASMSSPSQEVLYDVAGHVATITLNAPERMNTISGPMLDVAI